MKILTPSKKSRAVRLKDIPRVLTESTRIKIAMLTPFPGRYPAASSISHCQMSEDPLRFFVLGNSWHVFEGRPMKMKKFFGFPWVRTIINPKIVKKGTDVGRGMEGCMSFSEDAPRKIQRYEIVWVKYWTFFGQRERKFYLYSARVLQHEIDHMNVTLIYDRIKEMRRAKKKGRGRNK